MKPLVVPLRTGRGLNGREHWRARSKRVKAERQVVAAALDTVQTPMLPAVCTLTRLGPSNGLDDDNLAGSLKAVRDQVAEWIGVDDRKREVVRYAYAQTRTKEWAVRIEFAPMCKQVPAVLSAEPAKVTT